MGGPSHPRRPPAIPTSTDVERRESHGCTDRRATSAHRHQRARIDTLTPIARRQPEVFDNRRLADVPQPSERRYLGIRRRSEPVAQRGLVDPPISPGEGRSPGDTVPRATRASSGPLDAGYGRIGRIRGHVGPRSTVSDAQLWGEPAEIANPAGRRPGRGDVGGEAGRWWDSVRAAARCYL